MKKSTLFIITLIAITSVSYAQSTDWQLVEGKITTPWSSTIDPENPLPEYPRPQMQRKSNWVSLNGLWDYAIRKVDETPSAINDGKILVPFAAESALSGVGKTVSKENNLWYKRSFTLPKEAKGKKILLHFGAVDWRTEVHINGKSAGIHEGGFDPFSFDITSLIKGKEQELIVKVWDPTDEGFQPRGKQVNDPQSIWYTPVTGIWQTVWLEFVPETHIVSFKQTPDIDNQQLTLAILTANLQSGDVVKIAAWENDKKIAEQLVNAPFQAALKIKNPKLWSPANPFLYDLKITIERKGKVIDEVKSYFAMRKIAIQPDATGIQRILLNNEFVFQYGPLDQGWWPDGLYTAPTDEALQFDIAKTKEMGFNMIRKHIKVEPARWYFYCDSIGILVWQDMPSGDISGNRWQAQPGILSIEKGQDKIRSAQSEAVYRKEWNAITDALHNHPCIVLWIPFNEAWGQFKTGEITEWTMQKDPSRLVNSASGGSFFPVGHIVDLHQYPEPAMPHPDLFGAKQALVLGEFGGLGLPLTGHVWQEKDNWGYQSFKNEEELLKRYVQFISDLKQLIDKGLSAAVYTQTTDVEIETNGLITYDRKVVKLSEAKLWEVHQKLYK
ncbi:MAG: beta-galactosidase [Dysgonamonadaceae bacterium]|jgi:beta-galactosidase/beta-glucuronidase|nr:beta-galactosidase [Dysgonamonadaceae bacterium]